jgi:hypothetical protein
MAAVLEVPGLQCRAEWDAQTEARAAICQAERGQSRGLGPTAIDSDHPSSACVAPRIARQSIPLLSDMIPLLSDVIPLLCHISFLLCHASAASSDDSPLLCQWTALVCQSSWIMSDRIQLVSHSKILLWHTTPLLWLSKILL